MIEFLAHQEAGGGALSDWQEVARVLLGTLASTVALVAILISSASAVHDLVFQLDGDVAPDPDTVGEPPRDHRLRKISSARPTWP